MSSLFPESPILFYPSLACRLGTDEALLLAIYHQYGQHHGGIEDDASCSFIVSRREWLRLAEFWDEERLARVTGSLVEQEVLDAEMQPNRSMRIRLLADAAEPIAPAKVSSITDTAEMGSGRSQAVPVSYEASYSAQTSISEKGRLHNDKRRLHELCAGDACDAAEAGGRSLPDYGGNALMQRGPAPSFGGSTGWRKPKDELEALFEQQEARNRQLHAMSIDWEPGSTTWQLLAKQLVPEDFARERIEEFIAYWIDKNRREASWDHLFIRLVTREWAKAQGRQARQDAQPRVEGEAKSERDQTDTRAQRRERITDAVMDIHNTDW